MISRWSKRSAIAPPSGPSTTIGTTRATAATAAQAAECVQLQTSDTRVRL
jgi:hypothetical protein